MVVPQRAFHGPGRAAERGDRMPAAGIAEKQVTEDACGGAVRVRAIGTHRLSRPWAQERSWYWSSNGSRAWRYVSSLRVSAPWFDVNRR
ncbi:hypothetical protein EASAB2608_01336 [Streptomyces sp. EAS-AB2608]|uniref:Uncharacterized protein n=1 Tax=Streptomyces bangladeshensis TaxID=295352 RepID=A0ABN3C5U2_9ACTN|nr:hypothetical protein EASAB2608_01336 [Streptomyces sp. EAS-AB2608]